MQRLPRQAGPATRPVPAGRARKGVRYEVIGAIMLEESLHLLHGRRRRQREERRQSLADLEPLEDVLLLLGRVDHSLARRGPAGVVLVAHVLRVRLHHNTSNRTAAVSAEERRESPKTAGGRWRRRRRRHARAERVARLCSCGKTGGRRRRQGRAGAADGPHQSSWRRSRKRSRSVGVGTALPAGRRARQQERPVGPTQPRGRP